MNKEEYIREDFAEISSTNDYAKAKRTEGKNRIVTAKRQTGGRGTKGRSFVSTEGGVYVTKLRFYENLPAAEAFTIMAQAAVAVCRTLEFYDIKPVIKWANDIYVADKKICGILIENVFSGKNVRSSVVGVGLNVVNELPQELCEIATTMQKTTGKTYSVEEVRERLVSELCREVDMQEYLSRVGYMGVEATLIFEGESLRGKLLSVDEQGGLWVEIDGEKRRLTAAEVSVKIAR